MLTGLSAAVHFSATEQAPAKLLEVEFMRIAVKLVALFTELDNNALAICAGKAADNAEFLRYAELSRTADQLKKEGGGIAVFGSARPSVNDSNPIRRRAYTMAQELGELITKTRLPMDAAGTMGTGLAVITGAGPGLMQASVEKANRRVHAFAIRVPHETEPNPYVDNQRLATFDSYTHRKLGLIEESRAFVVAPGGFGTMEELLEVLNLMASGAISKRPIVFLDSSYWEPIVTAMRENNCIPVAVDDVLAIKDAPTAAIKWIEDWYNQHSEAHNFTPYRMLLKSGQRSAVKLRDCDINSLGNRHETITRLEEISNLIKEAIAPRLARILEAETGDRVEDLLLKQGQPAVYGFLKWFVDRLILECHFNKAALTNFVFLASDPDTDSANRLLNSLLSEDLGVITVSAGEVAQNYRKKVGIKCRRVLTISTPGQEPVRVPVHYNGNIGGGVFGSQKLNRIVIGQEPGPWGLADLYLALCWRQTGKVPNQLVLQAAPMETEGTGGFDQIHQAFLRQALEGEFVSPGDRELVK